MDVTIQPIARMRSDFSTKFGIPRQSGLVEQLRSTIVFEPEYRNPDALRGIEEFSHLWLIWQFSEAVRQGWSPTVRPPRLGGNTRMGVFATRSPFRPNNLGLSSVRLLEVEQTGSFGTVLHVGGADLMDGTPIFDIKPYRVKGMLGELPPALRAGPAGGTAHCHRLPAGVGGSRQVACQARQGMPENSGGDPHPGVRGAGR